MGGYAAGAPISREGSRLKPPILVRNKEDYTSISLPPNSESTPYSHAYMMAQERNSELIPSSARTCRRRRPHRCRQGRGRSPIPVGMAR